MGEKTGALTVDKIQNRVYVIRGQQVMLTMIWQRFTDMK